MSSARVGGPDEGRFDNGANGLASSVDAQAPARGQPRDAQQILDTLPTQTPGRPPYPQDPAKRDRTLWWFTILGSNLIATVKEALATAPGVTAVDLAVLTRPRPRPRRTQPVRN